MNQITIATILAILATTTTAQNSAYCQVQCQGQTSTVCGTNGITYSSICELQCNGQGILYRGACQPNSPGNGTDPNNPPIFGNPGANIPPTTGAPGCSGQCLGQTAIVCGSDGLTYQSPCHLQCTSSVTTVVSRGYCTTGSGVVLPPGNGSGPVFGNPGSGSCVCTSDFSPVCGADGNTYSNSCLAACAATTVVHAGVCQNCSNSCPTYISYVCGTNGVTYQNQCFLVCQGNVGLAKYGTC